MSFLLITFLLITFLLITFLLIIIIIITLRFFRATQLGIAASSLHGSTPRLGR